MAQETLDLFVEEADILAAEAEVEVLPDVLSLGSSTLSSVGSLSSFASAPTASSGACLSSASSWAPD